MKRFFGIFALVAMIMTSCGKDDTQDVAGNIVDDNSISFSTIVGDDSPIAWATDDEVGVFQFSGDELLHDNVLYYNSSYTPTVATFLADDVEKTLYYMDDKAEVVLYYPYSTNFTDGTGFKLDLTDQSEYSEFEIYSTDLQRLTKDEATNLEFIARLDLPSIALRFYMDDEDANMENATISISGLYTTGVYDLSDNSFVLDEVTAPIKGVRCATESNIGYAVVLPQSVSGEVTLSVSSVDLGFHEATIDLATLESGTTPAFDVEIYSDNRVEMTITSSNIADWDLGEGDSTNAYDSGETDLKIGDFLYLFDTGYLSSADYDSDKTLVGIVFDVDEDGKGGKVLNLAGQSSTKWASSTSINGVNYSSSLLMTDATAEGLAVMKAAYGVNSTLSAFPVFAYIAGFNDSALDYSKIADDATGVWYLPNTTCVATLVESRDAVEQSIAILTEAGVTALTTKTNLMTATEVSTAVSNYYYRKYAADSGDGGLASLAKTAGTSAGLYARPVMNFDIDDNSVDEGEPEPSVAVSEITITGASTEVDLGRSVVLTADVSDPAATKGSDWRYDWTSEDGVTLEVDGDDNSIVTVTADSGTTATISVTVTDAYGDTKSADYNITISTEISIAVGDFLYSDLSFSSTLDSSKSLLGIVYLVNPDNTTGRAIYYKQQTGDFWATSSSKAATATVALTIWSGYTWGTYSLKYTGYGFEFMQGLYKYDDNSFANLPAFKWIADLNPSVDYATSDGKNVWYAPTEADYAFEIDTAIASISASIEAAGGDAISNTSGYFTSTEVPTNTSQFRRVTISNGNTGSGAGENQKTSAANNIIRAIMDFDLNGSVPSGGDADVDPDPDVNTDPIPADMAITGSEAMTVGEDNATFAVTDTATWTYAWSATSGVSIVGDATGSSIEVKAESEGTATVTVVVTDSASNTETLTFDVAVAAEVVEPDPTPAAIAVGDYLYLTEESAYEYSSEYDEDKYLVGVVYIVDEDDSTKGKVLNIGCKTNVAWSTNKTTLIISAKEGYSGYAKAGTLDDGTAYSATDEPLYTACRTTAGMGLMVMKEAAIFNSGSSDYGTLFPAFKWVADLNAATVDYSTVADDAENVWYLPSEGCVKTELIPAMASINPSLEAATNGVQITGNLMTTTEASITNYRYVTASTSATTVNGKTATTGGALYARAIMDFDIDTPITYPQE
ncbi:MAG: hypothetical protein R3Y68_04480 [Rikenellaceae bacterium]